MSTAIAAPPKVAAPTGPVLALPAFPLSTVGAKSLMAVTGLLLIGFLFAHMAGNLLIFAGPSAINAYAQKLKDLGPLLWVARGGLLLLFLVHLFLAFLLTARNRAARPQRYVIDRTMQASWASRYMMLTGLVVLAFLLYHLAHFTFGFTHTANGINYLELHETYTGYDGKEHHRHDVYRMVIAGFQNPYISGIYLAAQLLLALHLYHGASSMLQTLGLNHPQYNGIFRGLGLVVCTILAVGNCGIVLAVFTGFLA